MNIERFQDQLRMVLNHLSDVAFLENQPRLISIFLSEEQLSQPNRIQILRNLIGDGIKVLNPPADIPANAAEWRSSRVLTMRYINGMELYRIEEELGLSQRQVQREIKKGVEALASILWERLSPAQKHASGVEQSHGELGEPQDVDILRKELKSWDITLSFSNLRTMIEQALHLCEFLTGTDHKTDVRYDEVDPDLYLMVDPILTKQGLYKTLSMAITSARNVGIEMKTRQLNDHFVELNIMVDPIDRFDRESWQIANLFFAVQGFSDSVHEQPGQAIITIILPLMNQGKCLVIDDVVSVRSLIERMLSPFGIQVFGAAQPQEALNLAQLVMPNFILLDVLMPKMDGWELIKQIKLNPETKSIPVIICSALYEPDLARAVGAAGYIKKPIDRLDLIGTLQQAGLLVDFRGDPSE